MPKNKDLLGLENLSKKQIDIILDLMNTMIKLIHNLEGRNPICHVVYQMGKSIGHDFLQSI